METSTFSRFPATSFRIFSLILSSAIEPTITTSTTKILRNPNISIRKRCVPVCSTSPSPLANRRLMTFNNINNTKMPSTPPSIHNALFGACSVATSSFSMPSHLSLSSTTSDSFSESIDFCRMSRSIGQSLRTPMDGLSANSGSALRKATRRPGKPCCCIR